MKINIMRRWARGDVFLVEPILRQLSKEHDINLITMHPDLFHEKYPFTVNKNPDFDVMINLDGVYEQNPNQHILNSYIDCVSQHLNYSLHFEKPKIIFNDYEKILIEKLKKKIICCCWHR
jgi:hypothetical protein